MGLINRILWVLNLLVGVMLLLSYLAPFVNPLVWWLAAFFGLAFPLLFLINVAFLIYWLVQGKLKLFFPAMCLLLGYNHYAKVYKLNGRYEQRSDEHIKLVSMNVKYFGNGEGKVFVDSLCDYLEEEKPDIICFQEYKEEFKGVKGKTSIKLKKTCGMKYFLNKGEAHGTVIFTRYKPLHQGYISFGNNNVNGAIWADLVFSGKDTVRVYSCHFQSNQLSRSEQIHASDIQDKDKAMKKSKSLIKRLKAGFEKRSEQVDLVREHMDNCPYPIILAGDLNDTQLSYTYRQLIRDGKDAFVESGSGLGNTYVGPFPSYRIDYIFYNGGLRTFNYKNGPSFHSDHKLIQALFKH